MDGQLRWRGDTGQLYGHWAAMPAFSDVLTKVVLSLRRHSSTTVTRSGLGPSLRYFHSGKTGSLALIGKIISGLVNMKPGGSLLMTFWYIVKHEGEKRKGWSRRKSKASSCVGTGFPREDRKRLRVGLLFCLMAFNPHLQALLGNSLYFSLFIRRVTGGSREILDGIII